MRGKAVANSMLAMSNITSHRFVGRKDHKSFFLCLDTLLVIAMLHLLSKFGFSKTDDSLKFCEIIFSDRLKPNSILTDILPTYNFLLVCSRSNRPHLFQRKLSSTLVISFCSGRTSHVAWKILFLKWRIFCKENEF